MNRSYFHLQIVSLFVSLFFLSSCNKSDNTPTKNAGDLISYELIDSLTISEIENIRDVDLTNFLSSATIHADAYASRFEIPQNAVKLFRVTYQSKIPEMNDKPTVATGLVAIPVVSSRQLPVISYQHGTVFGKTEVPSVFTDSYETKFMVLQFAAQGYVLFAPDYFGLGNTSTEGNSYFVRYSTEQACLDLYKAAQKVLEAENISMTKFFINGWSQGAYNTMLYLRRLERENISVKAAFTAAAPVDPQLLITRGLFNRRSFDAPYFPAALCNEIFSIEKYNQLDGISRAYIKPKYYKFAKDFYDFKINFFQFIDSVPPNLDSVFTTQFFDEARSVNTPFWTILQASEAYHWLSPTPLHAYYSLSDEAVPEFLSKLAVDYMAILGKTNGQTFNAGDSADHRATYIESIVDAKSWIDGF